MIIIPLPISTTPRPRCRCCGQVIEPPMRWWELVVIFGGLILAAVFLCWLFITLIEWLHSGMLGGERQTLVQVIQAQWAWLSGLRVW